MSGKDVYKCTVCGYLYDESKESIPFIQLPQTWVCPICGVSKSEFCQVKIPASSKLGIPSKQNLKNIVIVGSGFAGTNLAMEIVAKSADSQITLVTKDKEWFYSRPLLTRAFYDGELKKNMYISRLSDLANEQLKIRAATQVTKLDPLLKNLTLENNGQVTNLAYDKLILATGSDAFIPPSLRAFKEYFKTLNNLENYAELLDIKNQQKLRLAIIGGGLIGCELASEFNKMRDEVDLFHITHRLIENVLSEEKSQKLAGVFKQIGVNLHLDHSVKEIKKTKHGYQIDSVDRFFDVVLVAAGFIPRTELARQSGIICNRGIVVNEYMETSIKDIYAVGDVAEIQNKTYAFLPPIHDQINWLSDFFAGKGNGSFVQKDYPVKVKIHDFEI
ncbi:MAG: hypothetical protein A2381_15965 [Bdellovibrionales bacterium RIFOXYB1_FULL_37_110]|nr:MAG: hypothetical protein A2417_07815 [Bdellovibrionales bacterium RIFOXYC1_FULL_37_79]OFZ57110.1 MAG: hypothetical protein A2381_15965 [Bdellovibrionales bacterium RIFOXYB1_FULL_37_110]OFZ65406.1 MAG: hypothetical protein A2577_03905 [Bdellovibrionales bacterium RIFOXYD1_FULL_36_51]